MEDTVENIDASAKATLLEQYRGAIDAVLATTINPTVRLELCDYRRTVDSALRATINKDGKYSDAVIRLRQGMAFGGWNEYARQYNLKIQPSPSA